MTDDEALMTKLSSEQRAVCAISAPGKPPNPSSDTFVAGAAGSSGYRGLEPWNQMQDFCASFRGLGIWQKLTLASSGSIFFIFVPSMR